MRVLEPLHTGMHAVAPAHPAQCPLATGWLNEYHPVPGDPQEG
jgi:hypothetical protein